jgi:hypothetical protein
MADRESRGDWSWLAGTYWYVPPPDLPALQLDPGGSVLSWQVDQTVWHLSGYRSGYFWGVTAALAYDAREGPPAHGPGSKVSHLTLLGTILPDGQVQITFLPGRKAGSPTVGFGRLVQAGEAWSFGMQMSTERGSDRLLHWANMVETRAGDPSWNELPGIGLSVPQMLAGAVYPRFAPE